MKAAWYFHHPSSIFDPSFTTFFVLWRALFVRTNINLMELHSKNGSVSSYTVVMSFPHIAQLFRSIYRTMELVGGLTIIKTMHTTVAISTSS